MFLSDPTGLRMPFVVCLWTTLICLVSVCLLSLRLIVLGPPPAESEVESFWAD